MGGHNKAVDIIFHVFSILVAVAVLACAIYRFTLPLNANAVVLACYLILFGIVIFIMELKPPTIMLEIFGFFKWPWLGRGLFFIFLGTFTFIGWNTWVVIWPIITIVAGIVYIVMHFLPVPYPHPMLE